MYWTICLRFASSICRRCSVVSWISPCWMICFATARGSVVPKNSTIFSSDAFEPLWASLKISSIASSLSRSTSLPSRIFWTASGFPRTSNFSPDFSIRAITYSLKMSSRRSLRSSLGMGRLGRRRYPGEISADFLFREAPELLTLDDQADLDRPGVELLTLGRLLQRLETEDHRIVLRHSIAVLLFEEFHDRLPTLADAARLVGDQRAARVR